MRANPLYFLFFACISLVTCKDVYINSTALTSCTAVYNCYFQSPSLWMNSIAPELNDTVYITAPAVITFNYTQNLTQLVLQESTFYLVDNAQLTVQNVSLSGATIILTNASEMVSTNETTIHGGGIEIESTGGYAQAGFLFYADPNSTIFVRVGYLGLHSTTARLHSRLVALVNTDFVSTSNLFLENSDCNFNNNPIITNVTFWNSVVAFNQGWRRAISVNLTSSVVSIFNNAQGQQQNYSNVITNEESIFWIRGVPSCVLNTTNITGTLVISTSNVTVPTGTLKAQSLILAGESSLYANSLMLINVTGAIGEYGEPPYVNVTTDILHVFGEEVAMPNGTLQINRFAYFSGSFNTDGSVIAYRDVYADGIMFSNQEIKLESTPPGSDFPYTMELQGATLTAVNLSIGANSILRTNSSSIIGGFTHLHYNSTLHHQNSFFVGTLYSEGKIIMDRHLDCFGNFTQGNEGILEFRDINLSNRSAATLLIQGAAIINGSITYTVATDTSEKGNISILVVNATEGLEGKFKSDPANIGAEISLKTSLEYNPTEIYLVFFGNEGEPKHKTEWYIWFLIAIGFLIVGILFGYYIYYRKKRSEYDSLK